MKLVAVRGMAAGVEFALDKPVLVVGRGADADIVISDVQVSRHHAQIRQTGQQFLITDLGSTNGTLINGVAIRGPQALRTGDEIRIGNVILRVQEGVGQAMPPPRPPAPAAVGAGLAGSPLDWREPPPVVPRRGNPNWMLAGIGALAIVVLVGLLALLAGWAGGGQGGSGDQNASGRAGPGPAGADTATRPPISVAFTATPSPIPTPTAASLPTETPQPTVAPSQTPPSQPKMPAAAGTPMQQLPGQLATAFPQQPPQLATVMPLVPQPGMPLPQLPSRSSRPKLQPPFTVSWSPGRYEGWTGGHRMSSDLTIENISLPQLSPPYAPAFIIIDPSGAMRSGDLHDYSSPSNRLPTLAPGQRVWWTWFTTMPEHDRVRGSVFRYAGWNWMQEFNPDGSLNGPPRVISDQQVATFLPAGVAPEQLATSFPTLGLSTVPAAEP